MALHNSAQENSFLLSLRHISPRGLRREPDYALCSQLISRRHAYLAFMFFFCRFTLQRRGKDSGEHLGGNRLRDLFLPHHLSHGISEWSVHQTSPGYLANDLRNVSTVSHVPPVPHVPKRQDDHEHLLLVRSRPRELPCKLCLSVQSKLPLIQLSLSRRSTWTRSMESIALIST